MASKKFVFKQSFQGYYIELGVTLPKEGEKLAKYSEFIITPPGAPELKVTVTIGAEQDASTGWDNVGPVQNVAPPIHMSDEEEGLYE